MKILCAVLFCISEIVFAQSGSTVSPLKGGEKLKYDFFVLEEKPLNSRNYVQGKGEQRAAIFSLNASAGYELDYGGGRKEVFDRRHTLVDQTPEGEKTLISAFQWMPENFAPGAKTSPPEYKSKHPTCFVVNVRYKDVDLKHGVRTLKVKEVQVTIPVYEIEYKGVWSGLCNNRSYSGVVEEIIVFSPSLNIVLETRFTSFHPVNGYMQRGELKRLASLD